MGFREAWINIIYRAATGTKRTRSLLTPVGVVIFFLFTALFVVCSIFFDRLFGLPNLLPEVARVPLSILVVLSGAFVTIWSACHFIKVKGTPVPFNPPSLLVKTGPYRYVRNPMLSGVFVFLLGVGFGINSISLVFIFTPIFAFINVWELKNIEEPELIKRLGEEYIEYRKKTPMFFPGLGLKKLLNKFLPTR